MSLALECIHYSLLLSKNDSNVDLVLQFVRLLLFCLFAFVASGQLLVLRLPCLPAFVAVILMELVSRVPVSFRSSFCFSLSVCLCFSLGLISFILASDSSSLLVVVLVVKFVCLVPVSVRLFLLFRVVFLFWFLYLLSFIPHFLIIVYILTSGLF